MMTITVAKVINYSKLVRCTTSGAKIRWPEWNDGCGMTGTLRHLCPANGTSAHLRQGADLEDAWVRITTQQGMETWTLFPKLVQAVLDGEAAIVGWD